MPVLDEFDPRNLFPDDEQGARYDAADILTLFQTNDKSAPVDSAEAY